MYGKELMVVAGDRDQPIVANGAVVEGGWLLMTGKLLAHLKSRVARREAKLDQELSLSMANIKRRPSSTQARASRERRW